MIGNNRGFVALVLAAALGWTALAQAQGSPDAALAQSLFDEAVRLMEAGRYADACPKLAESQRLDPGGGTLLNLGLCREKEGKLATAWTVYNAALSLAIKDHRQDRERTAKERILAIGRSLARAVVDVDPATAKLKGLEITLDGVRVGGAAWGLWSPIDAGTHVVSAGAPGKRPWQTTLEVTRDGDQVRIAIPVLEAAPVAARGPGEGRVDAPAPPSYGGMRTAALVVGGVGIAAVAVGSVGGVMAIVKRGQSDADCPAGRCTAQGVALNEDAKGFAWVANVGIGVGIVALGAATVLWFVGKPGSRSPRLAPAVGSSGGGAVLSGQF